MRNLKAFLAITLLLLVAGTTLMAQSPMTDEPVQMADAFRSNGKIYVVVAVVVTLLAGVVTYLISLDRKISRLEKEGK